MASDMAESGGGQPTGGEHRPVDIEVLTEKVYRLMLADLRLDTARAGNGPRKG